MATFPPLTTLTFSSQPRSSRHQELRPSISAPPPRPTEFGPADREAQQPSPAFSSPAPSKTEHRTRKAPEHPADFATQPLATSAAVPTGIELPTSELLAEDTSFCDQERDLGLIDAISASKAVFCALDTNDAVGADSSTEIVLYSASGGITATVFRNFQFNLTSAQVFSPINDISDDGCDHDPRFIFTTDMVQCGCSEIGPYARSRWCV